MRRRSVNPLYLFFLLLFCITAQAQTRKKPLQPLSFETIDKYACTADTNNLQDLVRLLVKPCKTEPQKVRAIFRWITAHIAYDTWEYHHKTLYDSLKVTWRNLKEPERAQAYNMAVAAAVFNKRAGVCDGYSKLFKVMCDEAGIESVIIAGHGKTGREVNEFLRFSSNHAWNAVCINNEWKLLDATWASGTADAGVQVFTRDFNEAYFLTPPERFVLDHYPDDVKWLLLPAPISKSSFLTAVQRHTSFWKTSIQNFAPADGIIRYTDTGCIHFNLQMKQLINKAYVFEHKASKTVLFYLSKIPQANVLSRKKALPVKEEVPDAFSAVNTISFNLGTVHYQLLLSGEAMETKICQPVFSYTVGNTFVSLDYKPSSALYNRFVVLYEGYPLLTYLLKQTAPRPK